MVNPLYSSCGTGAFSYSATLPITNRRSLLQWRRLALPVQHGSGESNIVNWAHFPHCSFTGSLLKRRVHTGPSCSITASMRRVEHGLSSGCPGTGTLAHFMSYSGCSATVLARTSGMPTVQCKALCWAAHDSFHTDDVVNLSES